MWCLGTWFSGGLGSARLTVGLDDLKGLFQSKQFYDSMIPKTVVCFQAQHRYLARTPKGSGLPMKGHKILMGQMTVPNEYTSASMSTLNRILTRNLTIFHHPVSTRAEQGTVALAFIDGMAALERDPALNRNCREGQPPAKDHFKDPGRRRTSKARKHLMALEAWDMLTHCILRLEEWGLQREKLVHKVPVGREVKAPAEVTGDRLTKRSSTGAAAAPLRSPAGSRAPGASYSREPGERGDTLPSTAMLGHSSQSHYRPEEGFESQHRVLWPRHLRCGQGEHKMGQAEVLPPARRRDDDPPGHASGPVPLTFASQKHRLMKLDLATCCVLRSDCPHSCGHQELLRALGGGQERSALGRSELLLTKSRVCCTEME
ncbi:hypothetical protein QYF61_017573, partial [Mycteria americana]